MNIFDIKIKQLLLLDEPDSNCEPKLIENFFAVLKELSQLGIQIIMTTHRPDTIKLADSGSIWTIDQDKQTHIRQIKKCHQYAALFKLTYNLREIMYGILLNIQMRLENKIQKFKIREDLNLRCLNLVVFYPVDINWNFALRPKRILVVKVEKLPC